MSDEKNTSQVVLLSVITVLLWFAQYIHIPFQTPYLSSISVSAGMIGVIIGTYGLSQMLGRVPVGIIADLRGRHKPFIILGMACTSAASLLRFLVPTGNGYLAANFLSGLASVSWICFMVMYTNLFAPEQLSAATGRIVSLNNFGILLGFLAGMLMRDRLGMSALCLSGAVAALIGLVLCFFLKSTGAEREHHRPTKAAILKVFVNPQVIVFALVALIQQGLASSTANSFTTQVARNMGANGLQLGLISIVYILAAVISSNFSSSKHLSQIKPSDSIPLLFALLGLYCLLVPNVTAVWQLYFVQILAGMGQGWLYASATAEAMRGVDESVHSTAMGFFAAVYAIGMTVFPIITGDILESHGMLTAFYVMALICVLSSIFMAVWYHCKRRSIKNGRRTNSR